MLSSIPIWVVTLAIISLLGFYLEGVHVYRCIANKEKVSLLHKVLFVLFLIGPVVVVILHDVYVK